jgi:hypothetical protein
MLRAAFVLLWLWWCAMNWRELFDSKVSAGDLITWGIGLAGLLSPPLLYEWRKRHAFVFGREVHGGTDAALDESYRAPIRDDVVLAGQQLHTYSVNPTYGTEVEWIQLAFLEREWFPHPRSIWPVWHWRKTDEQNAKVLNCTIDKKRGQRLEADVVSAKGSVFVWLKKPERLHPGHHFFLNIEFSIREGWRGKFSIAAEIDVGRGITKGFGRMKIQSRV